MKNTRQIFSAVHFICGLLLMSICQVGKGQVVVTNTTPIIFEDVNPSPEATNPYPSPILVQGVPGLISAVKVTLHGFQHDFPDAVDILLEGPNGSSIVVLSDVGAAVDVSGLEITIDDSALNHLPDNARLTTGSFKPTNIGTDDIWPSNTPAPSSVNTLSVFNGFDPNGTWKLYASSDVSGGMGQINGWSLTVYSSNQSVLQNGISHFKAGYAQSNAAIMLEWLFDQNNQAEAFSIETSVDERNWTEVERMNMRFANLDDGKYRYVYKAAASARRYFRLKLYASDEFWVSKIVEVSATPPRAQWHMYPNPAKSFFYVLPQARPGEKVKLELMNTNGMVVSSRSFIFQTSDPIKININNHCGIYFVKLTSGNQQTIKQLIISQ